MKKLLALLLALVMCVALFAACSKEEEKPKQPDNPNPPEETGEKYVVVANNAFTIIPSASLTDDPEPKPWMTNAGYTSFKYSAIETTAPEGSVFAVKPENFAAFSDGSIDDKDIVTIAENIRVGTELLIVKNDDGTVKSYKESGKSLIGEIAITESDGKYTVKVGDKTILDAVDGSAKIAEKVYDSIEHAGIYISSRTNKCVFASSGDHALLDTSLLFGDEITTVKVFYDELFNLGREGYANGYDFDGDGKLDAIVVCQPTAGKQQNSETNNIGFLGDNHSYCGCNGYHTTTTYSNATVVGDISAKNSIVMVYRNYETNEFTLKAAEEVKGNLTSVDIATGKVVIGDKTYTLNNAGDTSYVNGKNVTQYETEAQSAIWNGAVGKEVAIYVDALGNIVAATLPELPKDPPVVDPPVVDPPKPDNVVDQAYALKAGEKLDKPATLTGKITKIGTAYSEQYKNITVTIVVDKKADKPIVCFRLKGNGADDLAVNDTITVTGTLMNYNGTIEFESGCTIDSVVKDPANVTPPPPPPPATTTEKYVVVANSAFTIIPSASLTDDPEPKTWMTNAGYTSFKYVAFELKASEGSVYAVKMENFPAFSDGSIDDKDLLIIESNIRVGTELLVEKNADGTVKSYKESGKSLIGEIAITESGGKYTVKVGNKTVLNAVDGSTEIAAKVYDSIEHAGIYISSRTNKCVFASSGDHALLDTSLLFGDEIKTVKVFYDELFNLGREGYANGYDFDGDGKLDAIVVCQPTAGKQQNSETNLIGFLGDNHSYCGCNGYHTTTTYSKATVVGDISAKNSVVMVYRNYETNEYTLKAAEAVTGNVTRVDIAARKVFIGVKSYTLNNAGDTSYVNGKNVTQYETEAQSAIWNAAVGQQATIYVDELGNIVAATLPALPQ